MATKLPYRIMEVLAALAQNPEGLTVKDIYEHTKLNVGTEVINEKAVGNIIYSTRQGSPRYTISRTTEKGTLNFITPEGQRKLEESMDDDDRAALFGATATPETPEQPQADPDFPKLSAAEIATLTDPHVENMTAGIGFIQDTTDIELEAAFDHLRNVIQGRSRQRLPNHDEIIALLRECENNPLFEPTKRALFAYARFGLE